MSLSSASITVHWRAAQQLTRPAALSVGSGTGIPALAGCLTHQAINITLAQKVGRDQPIGGPKVLNIGGTGPRGPHGGCAYDYKTA